MGPASEMISKYLISIFIFHLFVTEKAKLVIICFLLVIIQQKLQVCYHLHM